jgi:hypothetical protein
MIGEVTTSGSFAGALAYAMRNKPEDEKLSKEELEKKFPEVAPTADDPGWKAGQRHRVIAGNMSGSTEQELGGEYKTVRALRPEIKNPVLSLSARKAPGDLINFQTWEEISDQIIESLKLQGCPFIVIQHRDKDDHIHIVASRIRLDGTVISDSKSYEKVEQVMREVEVKYDLERVQGSHETHDRSPTWWEHKLANEKGRLSPKMEMQARISTVLEDQPTTTQFISRLREAHGIESIFRLNENNVPCGIAFRYGDTVMSGGSLGRGYTWKKLQERGLTYDERDLEAIKRARERAGQSRQSIADQERTVDRAARTVSYAGRNTVDDRQSGARIREATIEYDERKAEGQQRSTRPSAARRDQPPDQAGLSEAKADSLSTGGEAPTSNYGSVGDETLLDALATGQTDPFCININSNIRGRANTELLFNASGMGQSTVIAGNSQGIEPMEAVGLNGVADGSVGNNLDGHSGTQFSDNLSTSDTTSLTRGFRDGMREALRDVDNYMQNYWQEDAQYQSAIAVDSVELAEDGAEAEVEIEEFIEEIMLL